MTERKERLADAQSFAGLRAAHFARSTGTLVLVLNGEEAGLDTGHDGSDPWSTVCEDHGTVCSHPTLELARSHAACPEGWCEDCRGDVRDPYGDGGAK